MPYRYRIVYSEGNNRGEECKMNPPSNDKIRYGLDFILNHFSSAEFPRMISTKTTEGRQILINHKEEALARFKQANYLDCRISAYSGGDIKGNPNFIFIDVDSINQRLINRILNKKFQAIYGYPTVLFTGSGYHIYQPITSICLEDIQDFSGYREPSRQFLKFAEKYLSDQKCDRNHNPSFKSCMVRIPGSINSKNDNEVKIIRKWNGERPNIELLIGSFYAWLITERKKQAAKSVQLTNSNKRYEGNLRQSEIKWIEKNLLKTPLDDYRKTIVNLVLAPYLTNIRQLQYEKAFSIINCWLELCLTYRKLDFDPDYLINQALVNAGKTGYKPMRLGTLKQRNFTVYKKLRLN